MRCIIDHVDMQRDAQAGKPLLCMHDARLLHDGFVEEHAKMRRHWFYWLAQAKWSLLHRPSYWRSTGVRPLSGKPRGLSVSCWQ